MKSIKGLSFYNSEGSLIDVEELYAQVQQLEQDSAAKIIIGETASTTSTTSSDVDELAGTETDISLTNADDFKAGDMGVSIVTVTDRNNSHGFMVFLALADEPDQPAGTLHVRFITGIYNGKDGTDGQGATIAVGEVTTGAAGTQASVINSGTENDAVLDFTIPKGADGASGVTDVTAGTPTEQDGYTVTPVTFNFEQGNSKTVNIQVKNGEGAGLQQNDVINRTASVDTANENSPDFVENNGDLWVKKTTGYKIEVTTLEAILPNGNYSSSAATAPNGKIYVLGGHAKGNSYYDSIVEFDPITQAVTTIKATLPRPYSISAATAPNGKIYVFGGSLATSSSESDYIVEFDPITKAPTTIEATLPSARDGTSAATAPNGKIYVFGGRDVNYTYLNDIVEFDPVAQTATTLKATLPNVRIGTSAATAPNGKIYLFGGANSSSNYGTCFDYIVEFDPITQAVTTLEATLPNVRIYTSAATAPNGKIYVFGGANSTVIGSANYVDDIVEFDPAAAQYTYSPAVVLSQEEYTQFKNVLNGVFSVGISAPNAEISGVLSAGNTTISGTLTATGDISAQNVTADGAVTADSAEVRGTLEAGNATVSGTLEAGNATVSGTLEAGNTTISGTLTATGDISAQNVTADGAVTADSAEVSGVLSAGDTKVNGTLTATGKVTVASATVNGTLSARNTTVNGTLTATGKITAPSATVNGELTADSAEVNGTLSAGNTTVNGTLSASGEVTASSFNATT